MRSEVKPFAAIAAIVAGLLILTGRLEPFSYHYTSNMLLSVALLSGGSTYFWVKSRFYRKDPN